MTKQAYADIHVKVNAEVKSQSEEILDQIGISMSDLINMTLRRVIRERQIPFSTSVRKPDFPVIRTEKDLNQIIEAALDYDESDLITSKEFRKQFNEHKKQIKKEAEANEKVLRKVYA